MQTMIRKLTAIFALTVAVFLAAGVCVQPAAAAENGIYIAYASPHYRNPSTGEIEDAGGESSEVLGQSMTESATCTQALVEVDPEGNHYVTVRLRLMDNVQNVRFSVDGYEASADCMQEDYGNNTADFRMWVSSEYSVIRCSMYVVPMGRDVVFFITVSNLEPGSGDFITSVDVIPAETDAPETEPAETEAPETEPAETDAPETEPAETEAPETEPAETESPETEPAETEAPETEPAETEAPETEATEQETKPDNLVIATAPEQTTQASEPAESLKSTEAAGLQEFDEAGNQVEETRAPAPQAEKQGGNFLPWLLGAAAAACAGFAVWYYGFFRKK